MRVLISNSVSRGLRWDQAYVAKVMQRNKIQTRDELSKRFPQLSRTSVYRVFNSDWSGNATHTMIQAVALALNVDAQRLIEHVKQSAGDHG
jgi:hypothetical protein